MYACVYIVLIFMVRSLNCPEFWVVGFFAAVYAFVNDALSSILVLF